MLHDPLPCADRVGRLRAEFPETGVLLILNEKNIRYLTGFIGGEGALMAGPDWLMLLVDGRYATQARAEARGVEIYEFRNRVEGIAETVHRRGARSVGFESPFLSVEEYLRLRESLPGVELSPLPKDFEFLRAVKDGGEIDRIREAARKGFHSIRSLRPGSIRPFPMQRRAGARSRMGIA